MDKVSYYLQSAQVDDTVAFYVIKLHAQLKGYELNEVRNAWRKISLDSEVGEEAREYLEGITSSDIEIVLVRR